MNDKTVEKLVKIIMCLEGKLDIYNGNHHEAVVFWDMIWDEIKHLGYDPETVDGIKEYWAEIA